MFFGVIERFVSRERRRQFVIVGSLAVLVDVDVELVFGDVVGCFVAPFRVVVVSNDGCLFVVFGVHAVLELDNEPRHFSVVDVASGSSPIRCPTGTVYSRS